MPLTIEIPEINRDLTHGDLPDPCGWRVLLLIPNVTTGTSIELPDEVKRRESSASVLAYVMKLGPKAFDDMSKYGKKWCNEGDWVIINSYAGIRFWADVEEQSYEFRLVNDENIQAVVPQPKMIRRMG